MLSFRIDFLKPTLPLAVSLTKMPSSTHVQIIQLQPGVARYHALFSQLDAILHNGKKKEKEKVFVLQVVIPDHGHGII